ncbi:AAA family ATPase [Streptomyces mobaraensis]|uniref:nSTAND1 domain-containing NTPase n=1 Tax=Streptomyces mobaraensis TaxID=35621 RepID=UPI003321870A
MTDGQGTPGPRRAFAERFDLLYREAGKPLLRSVSAAVARGRPAGADGRPIRVPAQRISDWRGGRAVPARFEPLAAVLTVLIGEARRARSRPVVPGLYDVADWRARWQQATDSPADAQAAGEAETAAKVPCPYRGLAVYQADDVRWFFGREQDTAALVGELGRCLDGDGPLILLGASGAGKSSLLRAGLLPALADGALPGSDTWPVAVLTPTGAPLTALARALAGALGCEPAGLRKAAEAGPEAFRDTLLRRLPDGRRLAVVVDQFEEVFTLVTDRRQRALFLGALRAATAAAPGGPVMLAVLGLRADFYQDCLDHPDLLGPLRRHQLLLPQMTPPQLARAIRKPAEAAGLELEEGLLDVLLRDLGLRDWESGDRPEPGALPLLSHVLLSTWQQRTGHRLTLRGYRLTGGLRGSVAQAAERAWAGVHPSEHDIARQVLLRLVRVGSDGQDTRRRVGRAELFAALPDHVCVQRLLDGFAAARLLTLTADTVELTHEALLGAWPRLREWIEQDRSGLVTHQRLEQDAVSWAAEQRDPALLYRGTRLAPARSWADVDGERFGLSPLAAEFLAASTTAEEAARRAEQRGRRRLRALVTGQAVLLALLLIAGGVGFVLYERADHASRQATAAALMARYENISADQQPELGLSLVTSAYARDRSAPGAAAALASATGSRFAGAMPTGQRSQSNLAFDPESGVLATAGPNGRVSLFQPDRRRKTATLAPGTGGAPLSPPDPAYAREPFGGIAQGAPGPIAFAPRGHLLAVSTSRRIDEWDVTDPTAPHWIRAITEQAHDVNALAFSPDGATLAAAGDDGAVRQWDTVSGRFRTRPRYLHSPVLGVAFSPDGSTLAACARDHDIRLWRRDGGAEPRLLPRVHKFSAIHVAFSPDSRTLVSTSDDHTAVLWDVPTGRDKHRLPAGDTVFDAAFSRDGKLVATASYDHSVQLWDAETGAMTEKLTGHTDRVFGVGFGPDGHWLASVGMDGNAVLWDMTGPERIFSPAARMRGLASSPDGTLLATGDDNGIVRVWRRRPNARDGRYLRPVRQCRLPLPDGRVWRVAFSPDGRTLGIVTDSPQVWLLDIRTGGLWRLPVEVRDKTHEWGRSIAFAGTDEVLSTNDLGETRIWDVHTRRLLHQLRDHESRALAADPQGRFFARPHGDRLELLDAAGRPLADSPFPTGVGVGLVLSLSPDRTRLAATLSDQSIAVWQVRAAPGRPYSLTLRDTRLRRRSLTGLEALAFSPDGRTLAAADDNHTIQLWDIGTGQPTLTLTGHTDKVGPLAFSPDGKTLMSGGDDRTVRFWDLDSDDAFRRVGLAVRARSPETG